MIEPIVRYGYCSTCKYKEVSSKLPPCNDCRHILMGDNNDHWEDNEEVTYGQS